MRASREDLMKGLVLYLTKPMALTTIASRCHVPTYELRQFIREYLELRPDEHPHGLGATQTISIRRRGVRP